MAKFNIGYQWVQIGEIEIEAESLEKAKEKIMYIETDELPSQYLDDSFRFDDEDDDEMKFKT